MASVPQEVPQASRSTSIDRGVAGRAPRALWVAAAVGGLAQSLAGSARALLAVEVARSDAAGGLPQAVLVAGSAAAALVLSAVAARRGRRASLATGAGSAVAGRALVTAGAAGSGFAGVLAGSLLPGAGSMAVMPAQYAAADLAADGSRARAMGRLLVATTVGAVLGSNLLGPAGWLGARLGLLALAGLYVVAGFGFAVAATLPSAYLPGRARLLTPPTRSRTPAPKARRPVWWSSACRLQMPALVCVAEDDRETPEETTRMITHRVPRGQLRRYPGTQFDFYRNPVRQQVVVDQVAFLREHLAASRTRHGAASTATGHDRP